MKKFIPALLLGSALIFGTASCTREYYDVYEAVPSKVFVYTAYANDWVYDGTNRAFVTLRVNELNQYYVNQGIVSIAVSNDREQNYSAIPAVIDAISYSYDYKVGQVTIYIEDPIMEQGIQVEPPAEMILKIGLTEADFVE